MSCQFRWEGGGSPSRRPVSQHAGSSFTLRSNGAPQSDVPIGCHLLRLQRMMDNIKVRQGQASSGHLHKVPACRHTVTVEPGLYLTIDSFRNWQRSICKFLSGLSSFGPPHAGAFLKTFAAELLTAPQNPPPQSWLPAAFCQGSDHTARPCPESRGGFASRRAPNHNCFFHFTRDQMGD